MAELLEKIKRYVESWRGQGYSEEQIEEILRAITVEARTGCHPDPKGDPGDVGMNKEVVNAPESQVLDKQDIYCIARLIQGAWFQQDIFFGCANFCKYGMPCIGKGIYPNRMDQLLEKLGRLSGLNLSKSCSSFDPVERFSYDANDESSKDRPEPIYRL